MLASRFPLSSAASPTQNPSPPPDRLRRHLRPPLNHFPRPPLLSSPPRSSDSSHLLKHYGRLASNLAASGRLQDFLTIAASILTSDELSPGRAQFMSRIHTGMIAKGIASVLREGGVKEVLDFLRGADKLGICSEEMFNKSAKDVLAAVCGRLVEEGRLDEFVGLIETLAGYRLLIKDIVDPSKTLKIFVEKRDPDMAIRYASVFPHSQILFCTIIQEFGKKKDKLSAVRVFEASKKKSGGINMFVCRSIIDICGLCGDFLKPRSIFEDLLSQKITPNIYVFNSLMNVNAHDLSYTLYAYKHMLNLGVTADMTSYNILLKACCHAKRVDLAQDIYKEIYVRKSKGALKLDVITYSSMIKVFADAKMWQMAMDIKEDMLLANIRPNIVTWSSLISACASAGLVDRAVQVFEEMLQAGCKPNAQCCNILLYACVASCQYDRAFRFFDTWKETGFKICYTSKDRRYFGHDVSTVPTQNDSSSSTCIYDPQPESTLVPFQPTVATFNILMKACGTDHHRAKALMDEMKMMGFSPDRISWSILIDIYGTSHNIRGAMEAFKTMQDAGIKLDVVAYTTAIKELIEEWCQGVISNGSSNHYLLNVDHYCKKTDTKTHHALLLEKVATHLQKDVDDNPAVDIRGLTKVEARIVVLSVLRMIKERYQTGEAVKDDMIIIAGNVMESTKSASYKHEVQQAIIEVLRDELGLDVIATGHGYVLRGEKTELPSDTNYLARRPQDLGLLKVTRSSLNDWLRKATRRT